MNDTSINAINRLMDCACHVERGFSLEAKPSPDMDETAVACWWEDRMKNSPTGWAQFSGANIWFTDGGPTCTTDPQDAAKAPATAGILLAAELVTGEISHHLRPNGTGWVATELARKPDPEGVLETRTLLHSITGRRPLTYEIAWRGTPLRPVAFRLVNQPADANQP